MSYRFGWLRERSRSPCRGSQIHITGLPVDLSQQKLSLVFSAFGPVREVRITSIDPRESPSKNSHSAIVEMKYSQDAENAVSGLSKEGWKVSFARPARSPSPSTDSDENLIWSGFLSRSKRHKVGVDAYLIKGSFELPPSVYHLDIPFRSAFPLDHKPIALLRLESSNNTQDDLFKTYIEYFSNKNRAGYVPLGKQGIYIIPYGPYAKSLYPDLEQNQMLGFVADTSSFDSME